MNANPSPPCSADPAQLEAWLTRRTRSAAQAGNPIDKGRLVRTSAQDVNKFLASASVAFADVNMAQDADARAAEALGFDLVRRDGIGEARRAQLGDSVFVLRMGHAPGGRGNAQLGILLHIGSTLFLYVLHTARKSNLTGQAEDRTGNAMTEVLCSALRTMHAAGTSVDATYRPRLYARELGRLIRDFDHGMSLKRTLKHVGALAFIPHEIDMSTDWGHDAFVHGALQEDRAVESIIRGMHRPEILMQIAGHYYEWIAQLPFTHGPTRTIEVDPRTQKEIVTENIHEIALTDDVGTAKQVMRELVDLIFAATTSLPGRRATTDWSQVGELMAKRGLASRMPKDLKKGITIAEKLAPLNAKARRKTAAACATSLFSERWIEGWRLGHFSKEVTVKIDTHLGAESEAQQRPDGTRYIPVTIRMPLPPDGWGITEAEWKRILTLRLPAKYPPPGGNPAPPRKAGTSRLPLAGMGSWTSGDHDYKVMTHGSYKLLRRPAGMTTGSGQPHGWRFSDNEKVATMGAGRLNQSVGESMQHCLLSLEDHVAPVAIQNSAPATASGPDTRLLLVEATEALEAANDQLAGAEDDLNRTRGQARRTGDASAVPRREAAVERASRALQHCEAEIARLNAAENLAAQITQGTPDMVTTDTVTAEFVAVALTKCKSTAPPWLASACSALLGDWFMEVDKRPGRTGEVHWRCVLILHDLNTGQPVMIPLAGTVRDSARTTGGQASEEDLAWGFLYEAQTMETLAERAGLSTAAGKSSYVYTSLAHWLGSTVPDPCLRAALLHCPVPATRRIIWGIATDDDRALEHLDTGFVDHIRRIYTSPTDLHSLTWCRDTHDLARRVAQALLDRGGSAPIHVLLEELACSYEDLLRLARQSNPRTPSASSRSRSRSLSANSLAFLEKNFTRGVAIDPAERQFSLRSCPHTDCPERVRGGDPLCSVVLRVPETEAGYGVLCPHCRRMPHPDYARVRFPKDYLRPWSGRFGPGSKTSARTERQDTFISTATPTDPGPDAPLPDVGCLPRTGPAARRNRHRTSYVPRAQVLASALAAQRFLLDDLTPLERDRVLAHLQMHGGREAKQLRATVAAVVVGHAKDAPRALRATELGVPVVSVQEFLNSPPEKWVRVPA